MKHTVTTSSLKKESSTAYEKLRSKHAHMLNVDSLKIFYALPPEVQKQHVTELNLTKEDENELKRLERLRELNLAYHQEHTLKRQQKKRSAEKKERTESQGEEKILNLLKQGEFKKITGKIQRFSNKQSSVSPLNTLEDAIKESCRTLKIRVPKEITNAIKAKRSNLPKIQETSSATSNHPAQTKGTPQQLKKKRQREETEKDSSYSPKKKKDSSQEEKSDYNLRKNRKRSYAPSASESESDSDHTKKPAYRPEKRQKKYAGKGLPTHIASATKADNTEETPSPTSRSTPLLDSFLERERTRTSSTPFKQQSLGALDELIVASGLLPKEPQQPSDNLPTWQTRVSSKEQPNVVTPPIQFQPFFGGNHSSYSFHQPIQIVNITQQPSAATTPTQFQPFFGGGGRRPIPTNQRPFNLTIPPAPHYYQNQNIVPPQPQTPAPTQYAAPPQQSLWEKWIERRQQPSVDNSGVPRFHGGAGRFN